MMRQIAFRVANFFPPSFLRVSCFVFVVACWGLPTAYSQTLCPAQHGTFAFDVLRAIDNEYYIGIVDSATSDLTDNSALLYMEKRGNGMTFFRLEVWANGNYQGASFPSPINSDSINCLAIEKKDNGQISFYLNDAVYTNPLWVLENNVAYFPFTINNDNKDLLLFSPSKSEGLTTSCTNLLQIDSMLVLQEKLLVLSEAFKNEPLESRASILAVFPNPTSHVLRIAVPNTLRHTAKLIVTNGAGQQVLAKQWSRIPEAISIAVAALPRGTYFLQLISEGQLFTTRFMKQ